MTMEHLLPPVPTTQEMWDFETAITGRFDYGVIGDLYDTAKCPVHMLETMYHQFGARPLYWSRNPETTARRIYDNFYLDTPGFSAEYKDGILPNKGGDRSLDLFSTAVGTSYYLTFRTNADGEELGVTLHVLPLNREFYDTTQGGREYLERAYRFLLPASLVIDDVVFQDNTPAFIFISADLRQEHYTEVA